MKWRAPAWLKTLSAPRHGLSVLLSLAVAAAAVGLADLPGVLDRAGLLRFSTFLVTASLAAVYLALKGWQFGRLLAVSGLSSDRRARWLAFAVGEFSLTLPFGIYAQNYVLKKVHGTHFAASAASTAAMLALEVGFLVAVLAVLQVPGWPQMRPTLWGLIAVGTLLAIPAMGSWRVYGPIRRQAQRNDRWGAVTRGLLDFVRRLRTIARPRVLLRNILITTVYMLALMFAFEQVADRVSHARLGLVAAVTIYSFGLLVAMSLGSLFSQFGVLELSGAAAAQAWGFGLHEGLAMLLWFRVLWTASIWIICGTLIIALWGELRSRSVEHD